MSPSMKHIATVLTCVVLFYGYSQAVEAATSRNETRESGIGNITQESGTPRAAVSKRLGSVKPVNQRRDVKNIVPVIVKDKHVDAGRNVDGEKENSENGKLVSAISKILDSAKPVNQRKDVNNLLPVIANDKHVGAGIVNGTNKTSETGKPFSVVSMTDSSKPVNQRKDITHITPVTIKDIGNIGEPTELSENRTPTVVVGITEDKMGQVNQSKDISDIVPVTINNTRTDAGKAVNANVTSQIGPLAAAISIIDSVKPVNQSKDISAIVPVVTNATHILDDVNAIQGNRQKPVTQATDRSNVVPVETNIPNVDEVVKINGEDMPTNITVNPPLVAIENEIQPNSDIPFVDLNIRFNSISTDYCLEKSRCNSSVTSKTCSCDRLCGVLEDCCEDADNSNSRDVDLALNQFTCTRVDGFPNPGEGLMFVSKCPASWRDDVTKRLCEQVAESDDIFSRIPVSDKTETGFIYKNRHCAHCNYVYKYEFWRASVKCLQDEGQGAVNISDTKNCKLSYQMPNEYSPFRKCKIHLNVISECPASYIDDDISENCTKGFYSMVYTDDGDIYRNKHCAFCNGVNIRNLYCESQLFASVKIKTMLQPKVYSFRLIVDFNSKWEVQNEQFRKPFTQCNNNEIYDPFANTCREIFCPPSTIPSEGKCEPVQQIKDIILQPTNETMLGSAGNCTLTKIEQEEFEYINNTSAIMFRDIIFNDTEYLKNGSDILACLEKLNLSSADDISKISTLYQFDKVENYVSLTGLVVSITASLITLSVYIVFPQLLNTPGKNVFCLIISLVVSQVLFLVAAEASNDQDACTALAIVMHYFFLCAFCWMNVIAFDLWITFSHKFVSQKDQASRSKRFYHYSLYAWCLPLLIVGVAVMLNYLSFDGADLESFRPNYGQSVCWITSRNALLLFFAGPLAILKLFDFVSFGFTAYHIAKASNQGAFARKGFSTSSFLINLRLSVVMGLTWAFAFVANFTNNIVMWYLFIIFNTLQGLFIALSFLCTRKVLKLFREKYTNYSSQSSGTQMTTRPSYKSSE